MTSPYLPTYYSDGTVSVTEGETEILGLNTVWDGFVWDGDLLFLPSQPLIPPQRILSVSDNGTAELAYPWPGDSATDADYEIRFVGMVERSTVQSRRVIEQLRTVAAHGRGLFMYFDDATAAADPGPGKVRLNAAPGAATAAYIDVLDAEGASIAGLLDLWDGSDSTSRGWLELRSLARPTNAFIYELTGAIAAPSGYRIPPLALLDGTGSFEAGEALMMSLARTGDQGDSFTSDATAANLAARAAYDAQPAGYTVLVADDGAMPPRSRFDRRVGSAGTWVTIGYLTGNQGVQGNQGDKGWSPQLVTVADGNRRVQKLLGYVGGAGVAPTANVGQYLKGDGTFTATIGDAVDIRGQAGLGTVAGVVAGTGIAVDSTDPTLPVVNIVGLLGDLHNLIINPLGTINQRGYVSGAATTGANQYTVDRWRVIVSGQSLSWTETDGVRTFTAPAGGVEHLVEGTAVVGGDYVLNWDGTATATVNGTARTKGEVFALTGGSNVSIKLFGGTYGKPQLERSSKPTPFSWRHPQQEWLLCRWYYRRVSYPALQGLIGGDTRAYVSMPITAMRATPTVSFTGTLNIQDGSAVGDLNSIFSNSSDRDTIRLALTLNVALTLYRVAQTYSTGAPVMILDAEL